MNVRISKTHLKDQRYLGELTAANRLLFDTVLIKLKGLILVHGNNIN